MKDATISKEAEQIFKAMEPRFVELWNKLIKGNYNNATQFAYTIGFLGDIDNCLKKLKFRRTIKKLKNVHEVEIKDMEEVFKKMGIKKGGIRK